MYNEFQRMWDWDYIQQQQALQYHNNQVWQIADCTKKLEDFLESMEKSRQVTPEDCDWGLVKDFLLSCLRIFAPML